MRHAHDLLSYLSMTTAGVWDAMVCGRRAGCRHGENVAEGRDRRAKFKRQCQDAMPFEPVECGSGKLCVEACKVI